MKRVALEDSPWSPSISWMKLLFHFISCNLHFASVSLRLLIREVELTFTPNYFTKLVLKIEGVNETEHALVNHKILKKKSVHIIQHLVSPCFPSSPPSSSWPAFLTATKVEWNCPSCLWPWGDGKQNKNRNIVLPSNFYFLLSYGHQNR